MDNLSNRFNQISKIILYIIAAALPLWFLPFRIPVEFGREVTFAVLAAVAVILQLLIILRAGEMRWTRSPILWAAGLFLLLYGLSAFFSKSPLLSLYFAEPTAERLSTIILGLVLLLLIATVFKTAKEASIFVFILIAAGGVSALLNLLQAFGVLPAVTGNWLLVTNPIGTINGLGLLYLALLAINIGLFLSGAFGGFRHSAKILLSVSSLLFAAFLLIINFQTVWMVLLGSAIFLFGLIFNRVTSNRLPVTNFTWRHWTVLALIVFSVVTLMIRVPLVSVSLPLEVNPSLRATFGVAFSVFKESILALFFGSGPGTFGLDWSQYKDPSINQTIFWGVRFGQGYSWATTALATTGLLGALGLLVFIGTALFAFLRRLLSPAGEEIILERALFLGLVSAILTAFLYPATFSMTILLFILMGLLLSLMGEKGEKGFWAAARIDAKFESPWALFLASLVSIFFISLSVAVLYFETAKIRAAFAREAAREALNRGNFPETIGHLERSLALDGRNPRYHQALIVARIEQIRALVQKASAGENVQNEFQSVVSIAIQNSQTAVTLYPKEASFWRAQGALYETVIPFIAGSERFAFASYGKASELDPLNPAIWTELGRAYMVFAERVQFLLSQAGAGERQALEQAREQSVSAAQQAFQKAVEVKPDFASAHFLLAQAAARRGDINLAISSGEQAKLAAPLDIGIAFQLGLLYYQNDNMQRAEAEFLRALSINANYSNARYFLGLIYDRRGQKNRALEQFEQIKLFNPDNKEVDTIIKNLKANKRALAGIAPPAPEDRQEPPVR